MEYGATVQRTPLGSELAERARIVFQDRFSNGRHRERGCATRTPKAFLMISTQRSGTTALSEMVRSHPEGFGTPEVLLVNESWYGYWPFYLKMVAQEPYLAIPTRENIQYILESFMDFLGNTLETRNSFIVDIKYDQLRCVDPVNMELWMPPFIIHVARSMGWPIIHLVRKNTVEVWVSGKLADLNENKKGLLYDTKHKNTTLTADPTQLLAWVRQKDAETSMVRTFLEGTKSVELYYEDMFDGALFSPSFAKVVGSFLSLPSDGFWKRPRTVKASPSIHEVISNLDEVQAAFAGTQYSWMVESCHAAQAIDPDSSLPIDSIGTPL